MMRFLWLALLLALPCHAALASKIVVTVEGMRSDRGQVMVAIFSKPEHFPDGDFADQYAKRPASTAPVTVVFDGLQPGLYALGAYHDENGNGRLDTNFFGWPIEGYALSNGIRLSFYRPRFSEAAIRLDGSDLAISLHIGY
jgi:uncharacterized protein (DUF2141 family)